MALTLWQRRLLVLWRVALTRLLGLQLIGERTADLPIRSALPATLRGGAKD